MVLIHVARKPPAGGSLSAHLATDWGTGALAVDALRAGGEPSPTRDRRRSQLAPTEADRPFRRGPSARLAYQEPHPEDDLGRWPANLVVTHLPGCVPTGEVDRYGGTTWGRGPDPPRSVYMGRWKRPGTQGVRPPGVRRLYDCAPGCPWGHLPDIMGMVLWDL